MKNSIQKFGKFLSAMVMPNIGALLQLCSSKQVGFQMKDWQHW